jgi:hypothetical protein
VVRDTLWNALLYSPPLSFPKNIYSRLLKKADRAPSRPPLREGRLSPWRARLLKSRWSRYAPVDNRGYPGPPGGLSGAGSTTFRVLFNTLLIASNVLFDDEGRSAAGEEEHFPPEGRLYCGSDQ